VIPEGLELEILQLIDALWNLCLRLGGWSIEVVVPMSAAPVGVTLAEQMGSGEAVPEEGLAVAADMGYLKRTRAFPNCHPKYMYGGNYQGKGSPVQRILRASVCVMDFCKPLAYYNKLTKMDTGLSVEEVYDQIATAPTELKGRVLPSYEQATKTTSAEAITTAQGMAKDVARKNGTSPSHGSLGANGISVVTSLINDGSDRH
jgi:hypothetical protein